MRKLATILIVVAGLSGSAGSSRPASPPLVVTGRPTFFVSGHGWGHGLGLSQYGAYGYALHGWAYDRILAHYFPGTTLGRAPLTRVRVLVSDGAKRVAISSKLPFQVLDATGSSYTLPAGSYTVGASFKRAPDGSPPGTKPQPLLYPLEFRAGSGALALNGRGYRGSLRVIRNGSALRVVDVVGLEQYLRGVVPSEMPQTWASEALKAQAVAARSYALSHLRPAAAFDVYPDTRDQVYLGIPHEAAPTTAAVKATAGQVLLYRGTVAETFFFSSSGGRTASLQDLYPASPPIPYLVSVPDPYDSISPYHDWGPYALTPRRLARALKAPGRLLDVQTLAGPSGRVRSVLATGSRGQVSVTGAELRSALGLRSTWFEVGVLALGEPAAPVTYGTRALLFGTARGVSSVGLQDLGPDGSWQTVATLNPRGGTVSPWVKPAAPVRYRLVVGPIASASVFVPVAPRVGLQVPNDLSGFWGTVLPAAAGDTVRIQRQAGSGWRTLARAKTDLDGHFTVPVTVAPGTYRARAFAPGFSPGFSPPLAVTG
ncbi:MAG TPA: SpoIID/LytB domain-containing protein [Gaiellaceae bacterium]